MKRMRPLFALLVVVTMLLAGAGAPSAQTPAQKAAPESPLPDLSKLNIANTLAPMASNTTSGNSEGPSPFQVIVQFLQLTPGQTDEFAQLLQTRQTVVAPLLAQIQQLLQQLQSLLASGASPAAIGTVVIQINALEQQVAQHQQAFLAAFAGLLNQNQQQQFQLVQIAAQLQPVLPAFAALSVL